MLISSEKKFIAIAGNMGAGKSTLTELIAKHYNWQAVFETADSNPYLPDFFSDMKRWGFNHQMFFLIERFRQHREILSSSHSCVQDRTIYEDAEIFAKNLHDMGTMDTRDYNTYRMAYEQYLAMLEPPDLVIYLQVSIPKIVSQVQKRGRNYESKVQIDYLQRLEEYYEKWYENYSYGRKILINTDRMDYLDSNEDLNHVLGIIERELFGLFSN